MYQLARDLLPRSGLPSSLLPGVGRVYLLFFVGCHGGGLHSGEDWCCAELGVMLISTCSEEVSDHSLRPIYN